MREKHRDLIDLMSSFVVDYEFEVLALILVAVNKGIDEDIN